MGDIAAHCAKVLLPAAGNTSVLELTLRGLIQSETVRGIALAIRPQDERQIVAVVKRVVRNLEWVIVHGGATRQESVFRALQAIKGKAQHVLVHDAARPFCDPLLIRKVAERCLRTGACLLAVPVKASLKLAQNGLVTDTIPRADAWEAQTPQAFTYQLLFHAYEKAFADGYLATDDSELVERLGENVEIVEGSEMNIKITTPCDLEYAANVLIRKSEHFFRPSPEADDEMPTGGETSASPAILSRVS